MGPGESPHPHPLLEGEGEGATGAVEQRSNTSPCEGLGQRTYLKRIAQWQQPVW
jgi:hypothetical protein